MNQEDYDNNEQMMDDDDNGENELHLLPIVDTL